MKSRSLRLPLFVYAAMGFCLFVACFGSTAGTRVVSYPSPKVIANSRMVAHRLRVKHCDMDRVNDLLRAQIVAENSTNRDFEFEYKYTWLDSKGFVVESPMSTWITLRVGAKDEAHMKGVAPAKEVVDFIFLVRFPDRW